MEKEKLKKAEEHYTKIKSQYLIESYNKAGINNQIMIQMTQILLNLKTFALVAIPNLTFIGDTRDGVLNLLQNREVSARRVISTLRPLASAFIEHEVILQQTATRAYMDELKNFYQSLNGAKNRALENDPAIKIGDPTNVDRFAATPSEPAVYPL